MNKWFKVEKFHKYKYEREYYLRFKAKNLESVKTEIQALSKRL